MKYIKILIVTFAACILVPTHAFAIEATDILLPKPAEFFPALVAFLIIWFIMAKFVWPKVIQTMDARTKAVQDKLDAAEAASLKAEEALRHAKEQIESAKDEAREIVSEAKSSAEATKSEIIDAAKTEALKIEEHEKERIEKEMHQAEDQVKSEAADLAVELASKIIGDHLDVDAQRRLIEHSLQTDKEDFDRTHASEESK